MKNPENTTQIFNQYRALLFSIAYRMLGSATDAEDIVQEAFLRWLQANDEEIQSPKAFLSTVVTRLCIDQLRSARTHAARQFPLQACVACSIAACTEAGGLPELPVRKLNVVDG